MANLEKLHPYVRAQAAKLVAAANARIEKGGYKVLVTQGFRSIAEQNKLYAQGRTTKGDIVTNAEGGESMHNFGLAVDFALVTKDGKKVSWDTKADFDKDRQADWMEVVEEAKKLGFEWGGDWKSFKDLPHFQMLGGLSEKDIRTGKTPKFAAEKAPVAKSETKSKVTVPKKKNYASLVDYLVDNGQPYDFVSRVKLARKHGMEGYNGHPDQNIKLLNILQK